MLGEQNIIFSFKTAFFHLKMKCVLAWHNQVFVECSEGKSSANMYETIVLYSHFLLYIPLILKVGNQYGVVWVLAYPPLQTLVLDKKIDKRQK